MSNKNFPSSAQADSTLSRESTALLGMMEDRGLVNSQRITDEKKTAAVQEKKRRLFHNTESLLQNYRLIAWTLECIPEAVSSELDQPFAGLDTLLQFVDIELSLDNHTLESRLESVKKSRLLVARINDALSLLKRNPRDGEKMYDIIYLTYIAPEKLSHVELLYRLNLSTRHYYRLRTQAIKIISIRLWSTPTAELDAWVELLTLIDDLC
ncbi:MAG: hypothetical protein MJ077_11715 [Oscillospiraceae bacterium]|nr:hypothetical protein [Oscillospiraceae bacterium]